MATWQEMKVQLTEAREQGEIPYSLLDRLLERPRALDRGLSRILTECNNLPLVDDSVATRILEHDQQNTGATGRSHLRRYMHRARTLGAEDELRLARRIEFARRRLERSIVISTAPQEVKETYFDLIETAEIDRPRLPRYRTLSNPDERDLQARWNEYLALRNDMIEANLPLVERIATRYRTYGIPHGDLVQHGSLGLIRAAAKFDWRKNVRFRTYGEWWIRQAIERATDTDRDVIHVPRPMRQKISKANRLNRAAGSQKPLDSSRFAEMMGVDPGAAARVFSIKSGVMSLDHTPANQDHAMRNELVGPDLSRRKQRDEREHLRFNVDGLIGGLPERERKVIRLRYGLSGESPHTLEEVGRLLHISRERVRQLQLRAIDQLRASGSDPRFSA